jgi:hypothetical protein
MNNGDPKPLSGQQLVNGISPGIDDSIVYSTDCTGALLRIFESNFI